ncbi:MAG: 5-(carboxyamino)imidazole ribonucleotide mutase [bacterium]|nr:5-(carboxyamino)imidazole ribonucleotide mutase [bacterium]
MTKVAILMGSENDRVIMSNTEKVFENFGVEYETFVISAHRNPLKVQEFSTKARDNGFSAIICGAGYAAHLAGVVASYTTLPVLAVPLDSSPLKGVDSLYSMVMMPSGIPVATFAIGSAGAKNAAIFAIEMLSVTDGSLKEKLDKYRQSFNR